MVERTSPIPAGARKTLSIHAAGIFGLAALAVLMLGAALVGAYPIAPGDLVAAFGRWLMGAARRGHVDTVLFDIRLPRVLAAALVGGAIAAAGAAYQTLFR